MPLGKNATVGDWIHDFQSSTNPMFAGKSPEKRRQMAIAASYHGRARGGLVNHFASGGMWGSNLFQPPSTGAPSPQGGLGGEAQQHYSPFSGHMQPSYGASPQHHYGYHAPPTPQMFMGTPGSQGPAPPQTPAPAPPPMPSFQKTMGQETPGLVSQPNIDIQPQAPSATPSFQKTAGQEPSLNLNMASVGPGGIPTGHAEGGLVNLARNMRHGKDEPEPSDHAVLMPIVPQMGEPPMSGTLDAMTRMHENRKKAQGIPGSYAPGGDIPGLGPSRMPIAGAHLIHSDTPGRTDRIRTQARPGSFIIPADVVSGVGQGNTQAGAKIFGQMIATGPYGASMPKMGGGRGAMRPPKPPALHAPALHAPPMPRQPAPPAPKTAKMMAAPRMGARALRTSGLAEGGNVYHRWSDLPESQNVDDRRVTNTDVDWDRLVESMKRQSSGGEQLGGLRPPVGALSRKAGIEYIGRQEGGETEAPEQETQEEEHTPIITAGGEVIIDPEVVAAYGGGDIEKGKDIMSRSVVHMRKQIIEAMKKLPGPIQ